MKIIPSIFLGSLEELKKCFLRHVARRRDDVIIHGHEIHSLFQPGNEQFQKEIDKVMHPTFAARDNFDVILQALGENSKNQEADDYKNLINALGQVRDRLPETLNANAEVKLPQEIFEALNAAYNSLDKATQSGHEMRTFHLNYPKLSVKVKFNPTPRPQGEYERWRALSEFKLNLKVLLSAKLHQGQEPTAAPENIVTFPRPF